MSTTETPQTSIYETTIESPELETLLERRAAAREARSKANAKVTEIDSLVQFKITELDLGDSPVRVGKWLLTPKTRAGRSVSFETEPKTFVQISLLDA